MELKAIYDEIFIFLSKVMRYALGMVNAVDDEDVGRYKSLLHMQLSVTSNNILLKHLAKAFSIQLDSDTILFIDSVTSLFDDICAELYGIELPATEEEQRVVNDMIDVLLEEQGCDTEKLKEDAKLKLEEEKVKSILSELSDNSKIDELARWIESRTKGPKAKKYTPASLIKCVMAMKLSGLSVNDISEIIANSSEIREMLGFGDYPRKDIYRRIYTFARHYRNDIDAILGLEQGKDDEKPEQESEEPTDANMKAIRNRVIELARQNRNMNSIKDAIKEEFGHELQWASVVTWVNANRMIRKYHGTIKRLSKSMDAKEICKWLEKHQHVKIPITIMDEYLKGVGEWGK